MGAGKTYSTKEKFLSASTLDKEKEGEKEKNKKEGIGAFNNLPHYMRLYDVLKGAYSSYKVRFSS